MHQKHKKAASKRLLVCVYANMVVPSLFTEQDHLGRPRFHAGKQRLLHDQLDQALMDV